MSKLQYNLIASLKEDKVHPTPRHNVGFNPYLDDRQPTEQEKIHQKSSNDRFIKNNLLQLDDSWIEKNIPDVDKTRAYSMKDIKVKKDKLDMRSQPQPLREDIYRNTIMSQKIDLIIDDDDDHDYKRSRNQYFRTIMPNRSQPRLGKAETEGPTLDQ